MSKVGQSQTKDTYEDPLIVESYIKKHESISDYYEKLDAFARTINGKRILDVGCGPGMESYRWQDLGFEVTGLDYSEAMIKAARNYRKINNPPNFVVGDMREIGKMFKANSFDAAWVDASLIHVSEKEVPQVLGSLGQVVVNGGKIFVSLKAGNQEEKIVEEDKYGKTMKREFVFWEKESFVKVVKQLGLFVDKIEEITEFGTKWLRFYLTVKKP